MILQKNFPLVSIVIPVYNGANYMKEAIDSAINQTYKNIEVLVINDGSDDNGETEKIALSYGDKIRYFYKENGGVSSALNLGIREMKGEYFSWLSHDDVYFDTKIENQVNALLTAGDDNVIAYCKTVFINKKSVLINKEWHKNSLKPNQLNDYKDSLLSILKDGVFSGCALLIPKRIFIDNNLFFDENMRYAQDVCMWYQIFLKKYSLIYVDKVGVKSRVHENQLTQKGVKLYKKDAILVCNGILTQLLRESNKGRYNYIYFHIKNEAIHGNDEVVSLCIKAAKKSKKLSAFQRLKIFFFKIYGKIRPIIRKVYYRLFRKMKTN